MSAAMFAELADVIPFEVDPAPAIPEIVRRDIGSVADAVGSRDQSGETLSSELQRVLRDIQKEICGCQVTDNGISFAPS